ncbi:MAG: hypothetical protein PVJ39_04435 [Gammaproteobacteria bacterium]|jgi:hypothetical protein
MRYPKTILRNVLIAAIAINSLVLVTQWLALSPGGSQQYIHFSSILIVPVMLALLAIPLLLLLLLVRHLRARALILIAACAIYGVVGWSLFQVSSMYRISRFETVSDQAGDLVNAIRQYQKDNGHPPSRLGDLVPAYIARVPDTGLGAYPHYQYKLTNKGKTSKSRQWLHRPWVLYIDIPLNDEHSEKFIYLPVADTPQQDGQNIVKRLGDWVYVHD